MYCVSCGVRLADTEKKCPLCGTVVYHPDIQQSPQKPLYPADKMPERKSNAKALNGAIIILFLIPLILSLFADMQLDGVVDWFGYVAGGLVVAYTIIALPLWFYRPNPVIFVPCDFAAVTAYLLYIDLATSGGWFLSFALPLAAGLTVIVCTVVTLFRYLRRGKLYILGGAFMALGGLMLLMEYLMSITFGLPLIGWSVYPLVGLAAIGGLLIYLAINSAAREMMERKLFF